MICIIVCLSAALRYESAPFIARVSTNFELNICLYRGRTTAILYLLTIVVGIIETGGRIMYECTYFPRAERDDSHDINCCRLRVFLQLQR